MAVEVAGVAHCVLWTGGLMLYGGMLGVLFAGCLGALGGSDSGRLVGGVAGGRLRAGPVMVGGLAGLVFSGAGVPLLVGDGRWLALRKCRDEGNFW